MDQRQEPGSFCRKKRSAEGGFLGVQSGFFGGLKRFSRDLRWPFAQQKQYSAVLNVARATFRETLFAGEVFALLMRTATDGRLLFLKLNNERSDGGRLDTFRENSQELFVKRNGIGGAFLLFVDEAQ